MRLKILVPREIFADTEVDKVIAEAPNGAFCLLERHIDFVAALVPGILSYVPRAHENGADDQPGEVFVAVDEGVLVKCGAAVRVSVRRAVSGPGLEALREMVDTVYRRLDEQERQAKTASARLEANFVRRFLELREK